MKSLFNKKNLLFLLVILLAGCQTNSTGQLPDTIEGSLSRAEYNRKEIEIVLAHYKQHPADSLKLKAAIFLIQNIKDRGYYTGEKINTYNTIFNYTASTLNDNQLFKLKDSLWNSIGFSTKDDLTFNYDLQTLPASFYIEHIDLAFQSWQNTPWKNQVSFTTFCNFILPYANYYDYPERWRNPLRNKYLPLLSNSTDTLMTQACTKFNEELKSWFRYSLHLGDYPGNKPISQLMKGKRGDCYDMANIGATVGRALGLPIAIDFAPTWANTNNGHSWNAIILNDTTSVPFMGTEDNPTEFITTSKLDTKMAKVYRQTLSINESSFAIQANKNGVTEIPSPLDSPRLLDVTNFYVPTANISIPLDQKDGTPVYLCLFVIGRWSPIAGGIVKNNKVSFQNIGKDILYMPMLYKNNRFFPVNEPFILSTTGKVLPIKPQENNKINMTLYRKIGIKRSQFKKEIASGLTGSRFEGSQTADFKNSVPLYTIGEAMKNWKINSWKDRDRLTYHSLWEECTINNKSKYRFVRLVQKNKDFKIGELELYSSNKNVALNGKPIGSVKNPEWAFDGELGYSVVQSTQSDSAKWVGLDLGKSTTITKIKFLIANDSHKIIPGKTYSLLFWNNGSWKQLSIQKATTHSLTFIGVPSSALFWLHCSECQNTRERPFTYENNQQVWW